MRGRTEPPIQATLGGGGEPREPQELQSPPEVPGPPIHLPADAAPSRARRRPKEPDDGTRLPAERAGSDEPSGPPEDSFSALPAASAGVAFCHLTISGPSKPSRTSVQKRSTVNNILKKVKRRESPQARGWPARNGYGNERGADSAGRPRRTQSFAGGPRPGFYGRWKGIKHRGVVRSSSRVAASRRPQRRQFPARAPEPRRWHPRRRQPRRPSVAASRCRPRTCPSGTDTVLPSPDRPCIGQSPSPGRFHGAVCHG